MRAKQTTVPTTPATDDFMDDQRSTSCPYRTIAFAVERGEISVTEYPPSTCGTKAQLWKSKLDADRRSQIFPATDPRCQLHVLSGSARGCASLTAHDGVLDVDVLRIAEVQADLESLDERAIERRLRIGAGAHAGCSVAPSRTTSVIPSLLALRSAAWRDRNRRGSASPADSRSVRRRSPARLRRACSATADRD